MIFLIIIICYVWKLKYFFILIQFKFFFGKNCKICWSHCFLLSYQHKHKHWLFKVKLDSLNFSWQYKSRSCKVFSCQHDFKLCCFIKTILFRFVVRSAANLLVNSWIRNQFFILSPSFLFQKERNYPFGVGLHVDKILVIKFDK